MMTRNVSLVLSFFLVAVGLAAAPRNVVLFIADDMGQDAGCYGNRDVMTPALDQLAREGTLFRNAFCTSASCSAKIGRASCRERVWCPQRHVRGAIRRY